MKGKLFILLAACALAMLLSCSDDNKQDNSQAIETKSKLFVTAEDARDGKFLDARATLRATGETLNLTAAGGASGQEAFLLSNGTYKVLVEKEGYASAEVIATVGANVDGGVHIARNTYKKARLYETTASLTGSLVYTNANGKEVPAQGVIVRIYFEGLNIVDSTVYDTTDAAGKYEFANLPAVGANYTIQTLVSIMPDGTIFAPSLIANEGHPLLSGSEADYRKLNMAKLDEAKDASLHGIASYTKVVEISEPIVFTFSNNVNSDAVNSKTVVAQVNDIYSNPGPWHIEWAANTLTLTSAAEWEAGEISICFNNLVFTKDHVLGLDAPSCHSVAILPPDISKEEVKGLVNIDSASIHYGSVGTALMLNKVKGADYYEVFAAKKGSNNFEPIAASFDEASLSDICPAPIVTCTKSTKDFLVSGVAFPGGKIGKDAWIFKVRAVNSRSKTILAEHEVKDISKPNFDKDIHNKDAVAFAKDGDNYLLNFYNGSAHLTSADFNGAYPAFGWALSNTLSTDEVATGKILFSEDMDESIPEYTVVSKSGAANPKDKLVLKFEWEDAKTLSFIVKTVAGNSMTSGGTIDAVYSIYNLKDKGGNVFEGTYATSADSIKKGTIDIRFAVGVESNPCTTPSSGMCESYCGLNPTNQNCQTWACTTKGVASEQCQKFCAGANNKAGTTCIANWPCENDDTKKTELCKNQCITQTWKPAYCSTQDWTCNPIDSTSSGGTAGDLKGFGFASSQCDTYCTMTENTNKAICVNNRCTAKATTPEGATGTICRNYCKTGSVVADEALCKNNWACELDGFGIGTGECRGQCSAYNPKGYCQTQPWICTIGPKNSTGCKSYCMLDNPAAPGNTVDGILGSGSGFKDTECTSAASAIFTVTDELLDYCRKFTLTEYENATVPTACTGFTKCQIAPTSSECVELCDTSPGTAGCIDMCTKQPTNSVCRNKSNLIFSVIAEHLTYCKTVAALPGYSIWSNLGDGCKNNTTGSVTICSIYDDADRDNDGQCASWCRSGYGSVYASGAWTTLTTSRPACGSYFPTGKECRIFGNSDPICTACIDDSGSCSLWNP